MRYNLTVGYPHGGKHICLIWHEHNEGCNIIVARTEESCKKVFSNVINLHGMVEVRQYLSLDIVAPSEEMEIAYNEKTIALNCDTFWGCFGYKATELAAKKKPLPPRIALCKNKKTSHWDCDLCKGSKIIPTVGTRESEYERCREEYEKTLHNKPGIRLPVSKAQRPTNGIALYMMKANFGHHHVGVDPVIADLSASALFYYQNPIDLPQNYFTNILSIEKNKADLARKEADKKWKTRIKEDRKREEADLWKFFDNFKI